MISIRPEDLEMWMRLDPEFWQDIKNITEPCQAPFRIQKAWGQCLTTWRDGLDRLGGGQFCFFIGEQNSKEKIVLNFRWNKTPGGNYTLNRWCEELHYISRHQPAIKIYKSMAHHPNTQEHLYWCQFIEVRRYNEPIQCYVLWNGDTIIPSLAKPKVRGLCYDWTFDWRNRKTLEEMLAISQELT
jgi:hypothetical protein